MRRFVDCDHCEATGSVLGYECSMCQGHGTKPAPAPKSAPRRQSEFAKHAQAQQAEHYRRQGDWI